MITNKMFSLKASQAWAVLSLVLGWLVWSGCAVSRAQTPPPAAPSQSVMIAEVVKLAQAHQSDEVILAYIRSKGVAYTLSADEIIYLSNQGVSQEAIAALQGQGPGNAPAAPVAPAEAAPEVPVAAAPAVVTMDYFRAELTPYGAWMEVPGFGWCWRPPFATLGPAWRPYCDGGHWVYCDHGWFWQSAYPWGRHVFHYGRWHLHPAHGWIWIPGYEWGPAWVCWRHSEGYFGWAPLPPAARWEVGVGLTFNGHVAVNVDFGLAASHFTFVSYNHFWEHDYRRVMVPQERAVVVYRSSTVQNNYRVVNNYFVNEGFGRERVSTLTRHEVKAEKGLGPPILKPTPVKGGPVVAGPHTPVPGKDASKPNVVAPGSTKASTLPGTPHPTLEKGNLAQPGTTKAGALPGTPHPNVDKGGLTQPAPTKASALPGTPHPNVDATKANPIHSGTLPPNTVQTIPHSAPGHGATTLSPGTSKAKVPTGTRPANVEKTDKMEKHNP